MAMYWFARFIERRYYMSSYVIRLWDSRSYLETIHKFSHSPQTTYLKLMNDHLPRKGIERVKGKF